MKAKKQVKQTIERLAPTQELWKEYWGKGLVKPHYTKKHGVYFTRCEFDSEEWRLTPSVNPQDWWNDEEKPKTKRRNGNENTDNTNLRIL